MSWTYVSNVFDERYRKEPPSSLILPKNSFPSQEFELREKLADWLLTAFIPFDSLSWIDKLISKKECKQLQENLTKKDIELMSILSDIEYISALKRVVSFMTTDVPQKKYLIDNFIKTL